MIDEPTDLLDTFWGCFLHDYEDKYSVGDDVVWENESQIRDELDSRADCSGEDYSSRYHEGDGNSKYSALTDYSREKMARDPSLRRTAQLLEYARSVEAAKKKAARARRVRFAPIPEDRESYLQEDADADADANRVGPPQMIFVTREEDPSYTESDEESDEDSSNTEEMSTDVSIGKKAYQDSSSRIDEIRAKRNDLHRRIALLRIKAAQVRMAQADA